MTHSADVSGESDTTEDNESGMQDPALLAEASQSSSTTSRTTDAGGDTKTEPQSDKVPGLFSLRCECTSSLPSSIQAVVVGGNGRYRQGPMNALTELLQWMELQNKEVEMQGIV